MGKNNVNIFINIYTFYIIKFQFEIFMTLQLQHTLLSLFYFSVIKKKN